MFSPLLTGAVLSAAEVSSAAEAVSTHGFSMFTVAIVLHILLFVYWLGGDLGVFYSSRFVLKPDLSPETRAISAKIMMGCDMAPRFSLILFGASGVTLMYYGPLGDKFFLTGWMLALVWIGTLAWVFFSLQEARTTAGTSSHHFFHTADMVVRYAAAIAFVGFGLFAIVVTEPFGVDTNPKWLGAKVLAYGLAIFCGIMIRRALKTFGPAFGALMATGTTPEVEAGINGAIRRSEPWVFGIWALVLIAAVLGVIKPGQTAF